MKVSYAKEVVQYTGHTILRNKELVLCVKLYLKEGAENVQKNGFLRHNDQIAFPLVAFKINTIIIADKHYVIVFTMLILFSLLKEVEYVASVHIIQYSISKTN